MTKRQLQIGELIKRNFSTVLQNEGRYIYGDILVSVSSVIVTPDLAQAKIYLSIFGADDKDEVILNVQKSSHRLKQALVHRIKKHVRRIPSIAFYLDDTLDEIYKVESLFDRIQAKK